MSMKANLIREYLIKVDFDLDDKFKKLEFLID